MRKCNEKEISLESVDARNHFLHEWVRHHLNTDDFSSKQLMSDASFRRYTRIRTKTQSFIVMDAPPPEDCAPFVAIAKALEHLGLHVPKIIHANMNHGLLLLSDLGNDTYLKVLNTMNADRLYREALSALVRLQACDSVPGTTIPPFSCEFMWQEWAWHKEWFLNKLMKLDTFDEKALDECYALVVDSATQQPQVFMHRDFHSANLMRLPNHNVGILDFQDAFIGPVTYDVVSLLRDCYIDWPEASVRAWVNYYWEMLRDRAVVAVEKDTFLRWLDLMGVQRHLKALLTFARKHVRDQNPRYLKYIPRTLQYIINESLAYPELTRLNKFISEVVSPRYQMEFVACAQ